MFFGHNVLTYYSKLVSVRKRHEGLEGCFQLKHYTWFYVKKSSVTSKNVCFFQFLGHNVPINCSKLLGVRKRNEALVHNFT